jgi:hypothetical protein
MKPEIPTEFYLPFMDQTYEIHWDLHAYLMFAIWFLLVPFGIMAIRFFKTKPTPWGIPRGVDKLDPIFIWWVMHIWSLYTAIGLSLAGLVIAVFVSEGFSGSIHSFFGFGTVLFGCLQVLSAWYRGSHGGKNHADSDPDDPATWRGDHYDMTRQRRWFEAYHKTGGYFGFLLALGAVATGLMQFWMPVIATLLLVILVGGLVLAIVLEGKGYRQDTYRAVFGSHPDHPFNKMRKDL